MIIIRYTSPRLCIACPGRFTEFIDDIERPLIRSERLRFGPNERNEMRGGSYEYKYAGAAQITENPIRCAHVYTRKPGWDVLWVMERLASLVNSPKQFDERNRESRVMVEFHPFLLYFVLAHQPNVIVFSPPFCFGYLTSISSFCFTPFS